MVKSNYDLLYQDIKRISKRYPILSKEEELSLLSQYRSTGNLIYRDAIINSNMRMIVGEVKTFHTRNRINNSLFDELIGVAFKEGVECIERFRVDKGDGSICSFIKNSVIRGIKNWSKTHIDNGELLLLHRPSNRYSEYIREEQAMNRFAQKNGRLPLDGEQIYNIDGNPIIYMKKNRVKISSIERLEELDKLHDIDTEEDYDLSKLDVLKNHISTLPLREREIYEQVFSGAKKKDIIFEITPLLKKEINKTEKKGTNLFLLRSGVGSEKQELSLKIISYLKNKKENSFKYEDDNGSFQYNHKDEKGRYVIHVNKKNINVNTIFRQKNKDFIIYKLHDIVRNEFRCSGIVDLTIGSFMDVQELKKATDALIQNIRLNKTLMTKLL